MPTQNPDDPENYHSGGQASGSPPANYGASDFDQANADIPIWGWLTGATARRDAAKSASEAQTNRQYFDQLAPPTAGQLMGSQGSQDAQRHALAQLQQWGQGGLTSTDRAGLESVRQRDAQAAGAQQQALMQQAQARGVGGGGLDFATRQQAAQQGQQQASDAEAQMLQGAQQRALQSIQASGQMAGQMRGQDQSAVAGAYQGAIERARGATGQYGTDAGTRAANRDRQDSENSSLLGGFSGLFDNILG